MTTVGDRIKQLRKAAGMTQKELAKRCGYSSLTTINKIELGINSVPLSVVEKIAAVFGVSPSYIMGWENTNAGVNNGIIGNQNSNNVISVGGGTSIGAEGEIENELLTLCKKMTVEQKNELLHFAYGIIKGDKK